MTHVKLIGYNSASEGMKVLAENLQSKLGGPGPTRFGPQSIFANRAKSGAFTPADKTLIVTWGNIGGKITPKKNILCLNNVENKDYSDKKVFLKKFRSGYTIQSIERYADAQAYLLTLRQSLGNSSISCPSLVERHTLTGHSGEGIRLLKPTDDADPAAKLWTVYCKKKREFRVHFVRNPILGKQYYYQEKKLKKAALQEEIPNRFQVRNLAHGWVYTKVSDIPGRVREAAGFFTGHLANTLDFGAIDIIYNDQVNQAFILEVNTAPGLAPSVCEFYAANFKYLADTHDWSSTSGKHMINESTLEHVVALSSSSSSSFGTVTQHWTNLFLAENHAITEDTIIDDLEEDDDDEEDEDNWEPDEEAIDPHDEDLNL